jgi:hypothetical protein
MNVVGIAGGILCKLIGPDTPTQGGQKCEEASAKRIMIYIQSYVTSLVGRRPESHWPPKNQRHPRHCRRWALRSHQSLMFEGGSAMF